MGHPVRQIVAAEPEVVLFEGVGDHHHALATRTVQGGQGLGEIDVL